MLGLKVITECRSCKKKIVREVLASSIRVLKANLVAVGTGRCTDCGKDSRTSDDIVSIEQIEFTVGGSKDED